MKRIAILALIIATASAHALEIDLGSKSISDAAVPKVKVFLQEVHAEYRIDVEVIETTATNELGEVEVVSSTTKRTRVEVPEGDVPRLRRVVLEQGWEPTMEEYKKWAKKQRTDLVPDEEDPEETP